MYSCGNMSIWISEHFIQSLMLILKKILKILKEIQKFVRKLVSLKCRHSYLKLIFYRSCFECIEIVRIWFFWCIVTWLSLTLWCKNDLLSMILWLQITADPYFKTVTISTYDRYLNLTPWKLNFFQFLSSFFGRNTTSKSREMSFDI